MTINTPKRDALSRREFIKKGSSAAAAAGLAAAALGATPAILSGRNLNSRINFGVIGTGSRGCYLIRLLKEIEGCEITDVCDIYPPHLELGAKDSGSEKVRTHESWEKLVDQKELDAVIVAPPLFLHVPCSVAAFEAGKHVFSEKSMGLTVKELNQATEAAEKSGKVYMVGYQSRMMKSFQDAKRLVQAGSFGRITQFYVHYDRNITWRREVEDPKWERIINWRMYREYCGGILTELLTHQIDMVLDILDTKPVKGSCDGKILVYNDGREHHDTLAGYLEMEDGVLGIASGQLANSRWGNMWAIHGTHGTIEFMGDAFRVFWEQSTRHLQTIGIKHKFSKIKLGQSLDIKDSPVTVPDKIADYRESNTANASLEALKNFVDCIRNGSEPILDASSARRTSIAALMLYQSSFNGGRVYTAEDIEAMG